MMDFVYKHKADDDYYKKIIFDAGWEVLKQSQKFILCRSDFALNKNVEIYTDIPTTLTKLKKISNYALTCLMISIANKFFTDYRVFCNQYKISVVMIAAIIVMFLITGYPNVKKSRAL